MRVYPRLLQISSSVALLVLAVLVDSGAGSLTIASASDLKFEVRGSGRLKTESKRDDWESNSKIREIG